MRNTGSLTAATALLALSMHASAEDRNIEPHWLAAADPPLDLRLPPEPVSLLRGALPDTTPQRLTWCAQQALVRPADVYVPGCHDRYQSMSGRGLLIHSGLSLAARRVASLLSAD